MTIVWILLLASLVIYELITMNIVSIFYFCGIIISLLIVRIPKIPNNYILEIILAVIIGSILLVLYRKKLIKYLEDKNILLTKDVIKEEYKVNKSFKKNKGYIKISGRNFKASSSDTIKRNDKVIVENIIHNKLVVKKKD